MRWMSIHHANADGVEWKDEGWFFTTPERDYEAKIRCRRCGHIPTIKECKKNDITGIGGNTCAAPVFDLGCPNCRNVLASIDEGEQDNRPMLYVHDGELIDTPDTPSPE